MATGTNGIATRADLNALTGGDASFWTSDLNRCPTRSEIQNATCKSSTYSYTLYSNSFLSYAENQLMPYSAITLKKVSLNNHTTNTDYCVYVRIYANKVQAKVAPSFTLDPSSAACPANIGFYFDFRVTYQGGGTPLGQDNVYIYQYAGDTSWKDTGYTYGAQYYVSSANLRSQVDGYSGTVYYQLAYAQAWNDFLDGPLTPKV